VLSPPIRPRRAMIQKWYTDVLDVAVHLVADTAAAIVPWVAATAGIAAASVAMVATGRFR